MEGARVGEVDSDGNVDGYSIAKAGSSSSVEEEDELGRSTGRTLRGSRLWINVILIVCGAGGAVVSVLSSTILFGDDMSSG
jgi:hypothetical protein